MKSTESTGDDESISQDDFELDRDYIDQDMNRYVLSDSATLLSISPMKTVGKRDRPGYGKQTN